MISSSQVLTTESEPKWKRNALAPPIGNLRSNFGPLSAVALPLRSRPQVPLLQEGSTAEIRPPRLVSVRQDQPPAHQWLKPRNVAVIVFFEGNA